LLGWSSISIASLMTRSIRLDFLARMLVFCSCIRWPRLMLCSATADVLGWYRRMCRWWSLTLVSVKLPVCPVNGDSLSPRNHPILWALKKTDFVSPTLPRPLHWRLLGASPLALLSLYLTASLLALSFRLPFLSPCIIPLILSIAPRPPPSQQGKLARELSSKPSSSS
jgi:hypothetical protein